TSMKSLLNKLQVETFILDLEEGVQPQPLNDVVSQHLVNGSLEIELKKEQGLNHVFSQLTDAGVKVLSMRNKANRLEELFVTIVRDQTEDQQ
ncbi:ABC transporter ATP-binding protein, partial [Vibrio sp. 10N.222.49.C9]